MATAAGEEEIRKLQERLDAAEQARNAEAARAETLQMALFEAGIKARQAIDQCKRDAIEVAVEEAVREQYEAVSEIEEVMRRSVEQLSRDRAMLNGIQSSLVAMRDLAQDYDTAVSQSSAASASPGTPSAAQGGQGGSASGTGDMGAVLDKLLEDLKIRAARGDPTAQARAEAVNAAVIAVEVMSRISTVLLSPDVRAFLDEAPAESRDLPSGERDESPQRAAVEAESHEQPPLPPREGTSSQEQPDAADV